MTRDEIMQDLRKQARYAIGSRSRELVYRAYGAACMARQLEAISKIDFWELNDLLIRDTLNNGRLMNEWEKERRYA